MIDSNDPAKLTSSCNYRFIHPNFDRWGDHLTRLAVQVNAKNIVVFMLKAGSDKAAYTHNFFGLHDLVVDTFDQAQGLAVQAEESEAVAELRKLAHQFGQ